MRYILPLFIVAGSVALVSCKRSKPARELPDDGRAAAPHVTPAAAPTSQPATGPTTLPADATISEKQLLEFISASRPIVVKLTASHRVMDRSPEGFSALAESMQAEGGPKSAAIPTSAQAHEWATVGRRAWSAWSIAQVDYNAEAPLRENARQLAEAESQLAAAQATASAGARVMSADERTRFVAAAHDSAVNAADRAQMWSDKAVELRGKLADSDALPDVPPGESPALAAARSERRSTISAARAAMMQELAAAELNERQAKQDAVHAEASARHPETPLDDSEKADLIQHSRDTIEKAKGTIADCRKQAESLRIRLSEDRRVNADVRRKSASESDIALLRKHLPEFNDAWGMSVDGRLK